jgi:hypothetical protein
MDNNIKQTNINDTAKFINNTYDPLSYFDLYGNSVIIFILMTLFVFLVYTYCKIMQTRESIADDWVNQRCKPEIMPFAGLITHPEGTTAFQYTNDNFQYCVQDILKNVTGYAVQPFEFMVQSLTKVFSKFSDAIQKTREATNKLRDGIKKFAEDVLSRILNVMIPVQTMFIALSDTFQKIQGAMTGGLYTMLGTYLTLQSLMGAILELIIKILIALVIIIVGLWILPFTFPAAATMTAVFLAISVPMTIIVFFMTEVLQIKTTAIPKLRCFDKKTRIYLQDGTWKDIQDIKVNDILQDNSVVTAKIKVTSEGLDMYNLNGIVVSESHIIKWFGNWIPVKEHPLAIKIDKYDELYLYCLNTSSKTIVLNSITFTDWDEVYDGDLDFLYKYLSSKNISKALDKGLTKDTKIKMKMENEYKCLKDIKIGDILSSNAIVYGIVELKNLGNKEPLLNLLVSNGLVETNSETYLDYNGNIDSILKLKKILSNEYV